MPKESLLTFTVTARVLLPDVPDEEQDHIVQEIDPDVFLRTDLKEIQVAIGDAQHVALKVTGSPSYLADTYSAEID